MQYTRFVVGVDISGNNVAVSVTAPYNSAGMEVLSNILTDSIVWLNIMWTQDQTKHEATKQYREFELPQRRKKYSLRIL